MELRCYFVPAEDGGQYQWWVELEGGRWACRMWMGEADGVMQHGEGYGAEVLLPYLEGVIVGRASMVRVW